MPKTFALGALLMFTSIVLGAFGAHAFKSTLVAHHSVTIWQTAVDYHMGHGLSLLALAGVEKYLSHSLYQLAIWAIVLGVLLFSGSLYTLALTNIKILGAITPIGGIILLMAWGMILWVTFIK